MFIIGNKDDLSNNVEFEDGKALASIIGAKFYETSAKNAHNVEETFREFARELIDYRKNTIVPRESSKPAVVLTNDEMINNENACC